MKLYYIIAPYTGNSHVQTKHNISQAEILAEYYWTQGHAVLCPHLNTAFFSGLVPEKQFYNGTILMLSKCDKAIIHPRYKNSKGCMNEIKFCEANNIPHEYIDEFQLRIIKNELRKI